MSLRPGSLPFPTTRPAPTALLARDHPHAVVVARTRQAAWERVTRGAYVVAGSASSRSARALATVAGVHARLVTPHWFSHESAALVWGLPVWRTPAVTHVRQLGRPGSGRDRAVARHGGAVDARHLTLVGDIPVTDLELTMVDCARSLPPLAGLVVADAALRAGADRAVALGMLDELRGRNGVARARAVIELADEGAESPGETATRFVLLRDGLPRPATQIPVVTRLGTFWTDVGWEQWKVFLEYDGWVKYRSVDDLVAEKRRHDAIVETGCRVVRVTKEDIPRRAGLTARVSALLPSGVPVVRRLLLHF